jgi:Family of unknown function (DUF6236)
MSGSQRIGLYYPYLHFSDSWLKVAALYWPRMGRIVPSELHLSDSRTVRELSDELNFTVNVAPGSAAEELTSTLAGALEAHCDEFRNRYSIAANPSITSNSCAPSWPNPQPTISDWRARNPGELRAAAEVVALHTGKGADHLWQMLSDAGLAVRSGDWWGLHPELAWLYMCALTDKLARRNLLTPTTDQITAHVESLSWTDDLFISTLLEHDPAKIAVPQSGHRERIALLALNLVVPNNLEDVPVQKIIKIRQNYAADFDAFYDEVVDLENSLGNELSEIADPEVLAAYIDYEAQRRFRQPLDNLRREMRGQGVDAAVTAFTTKFELPTSAAIVAGGLLTHHPVVAAGGAIALGIVSTIRSFQRDRRHVTPSPASYLWRIEQTLNPENLMSGLLRQMY